MAMNRLLAAGALSAVLCAATGAGAAGPGLAPQALDMAHGSGILHRTHDAAQVVDELRAKGYYRIVVTDPYLPKIQINACKDGNRWHLHANYYGDIYHRDLIGPCNGYGRRYGRRGYGDWWGSNGDY